MQVIFLGDYPQAITLVADWYYHEWGVSNPNLTLAGIEKTLRKSLNTDKLPLILLAIDDDNIIGAVELKIREMTMFPDREHWLGGMFVRSDYRSTGIGRILIEKALTVAARLGVRTLHLQTEQLDGGLYTRLGWRPVEQVNNKGIEVLVMEREI